MSNKEIIDALKNRSDIFVERSIKDGDNVLRLLKKVRRNFTAKQRKSLAGRAALLRVFEETERVLEERRGQRLDKMNDMIKELLSMSNNEPPSLSNINVVNKIQERICAVNIRDETLSEVDNEFEAELNETITEEIIHNVQTSDMSDEPQREVVAGIKCDNKVYMDVTVEIEEMNNQAILDANECHDNNNQDVIMGEDQDMQEESINKSEDQCIPSDNKTFIVTTSEQLEESKANCDLDSVIASNDVGTFNETFCVSISSDSVEKAIPLIKEKTNLYNNLKKNSITSSKSGTETRTQNTSSSLFKSKFHHDVKKSNISATKPQVKVIQSSVLKRTAQDVRQKKELIDEEKRQKLIAKVDDHTMRITKMNELRKCAQSKALQSSKDDVSKIVSLMKNKDNIKTMPLQTNKSIQQVMSSNKQGSKINEHQQSALKTNHRLQLTQQMINNSSTNLKTNNTFKNQSVLKSVNNPPNISAALVPSTPTSKSYIIFKTPLTKKSENILSESCRKIVMNHESYSLEGLNATFSDKESDSENDIEVPSWTNKSSGTLGRLAFYHLENTDIESMFTNPRLLSSSIADVFQGYVKSKAIKNSGVWPQD